LKKKKKKHLKEVTERSKLQGLIIDLRGNLGGTLPSALDVAALFLKKGKVLLKVKIHALK
jgi:C-terminal processing protease CtpA/Prc